MGEIIIKTKYNKGDKLYCAYNTRKICPYCKQSYPHYEAAEVEITRIGCFNGGGSAHYSVCVRIDKNHTFSTSYVSDYVFCRTREEAQKRCDVANSNYLKAKFNFYKDYNNFA
nr:MAG TPA: tax1-binding protein [Caudoviricetes sp.]